MDIELTKLLATMGVGGLLAAIIYYQGRKDAIDNAAQLKTLYETEKGRTDMILNVVINNTAAITRNTDVVQSFHQRLDDDRGART